MSWDVLTLGLVEKTGLSYGALTVITSFVVLLLWIPLKEMPGLGSIANAVLVGISADIALRFIPAPSNLPMQWAYVILAILAFSFFDALYIGSVWIRTKRRSDDGAHAHHRETCRNHPHSP